MKKQIPVAAVLGGVAAAGAAGVLHRENTHLTVSRYDVASDRLPRSFDGLRLLHLSDLHAATFGKNQKHLLQLIDSLHADMAMITGDLIDRRRTLTEQKMQPALTLLRELSRRMPVLRVDGNHETCSCLREQFTASAAKAGAQNVTGRALTVRKGNDSFAVVGLPDISDFCYDEKEWTRTVHQLCAPHTGTFYVALSHRPQYLDTYASEGLPLVLCGHAHGGQVRLPVIGGLYAPEQGILPQYTSGSHTKGQTQMIVSRGLGNSGFPFRFCNRPEPVLITLHADRA